MFLLQTQPLEIITGILSLGTFTLVIRLSFGAGKAVQKLDDIISRVEILEGDRCPSDNCPVFPRLKNHKK